MGLGLHPTALRVLLALSLRVTPGSARVAFGAKPPVHVLLPPRLIILERVTAGRAQSTGKVRLGVQEVARATQALLPEYL